MVSPADGSLSTLAIKSVFELPITSILLISPALILFSNSTLNPCEPPGIRFASACLIVRQEEDPITFAIRKLIGGTVKSLRWFDRRKNLFRIFIRKRHHLLPIVVDQSVRSKH